MSRNHHRIGRCAGAAIGAIALLLAVAVAPAAAVQYEKLVHYDETNTFSYDDCGFTIEGQGHYWGTFGTRSGTGPDESAFFTRSRYAWEEVQTRLPDGPTIVVAGHGNFIEVKATRVEGSIFEFSAINVGVPLTVTDSSGKVILRDVGAVRESILFDTLGDDTPGGEFIVQTSFSVVGPHPSENLDWCALFES